MKNIEKLLTIIDNRIKKILKEDKAAHLYSGIVNRRLTITKYTFQYQQEDMVIGSIWDFRGGSTSLGTILYSWVLVDKRIVSAGSPYLYYFVFEPFDEYSWDSNAIMKPNSIYFRRDNTEITFVTPSDSSKIEDSSFWENAFDSTSVTHTKLPIKIIGNHQYNENLTIIDKYDILPTIFIPIRTLTNTNLETLNFQSEDKVHILTSGKDLNTGIVISKFLVE